MSTRCFLCAKIHRATVTGAVLDYEGSLTIDRRLMDRAGILPFERVEVYNLDNGERLATYAIPGGPGEMCLNGAAAHKGRVGDKVIVATYVWLDQDEAAGFRPRVLIVDKDNAVTRCIDYQIPEPPGGE
ncbi:MAG: aspartate 1-decarboxylase [Desulfovibrionaceae bacterium]|nr:aspartate 1-decarboxylase [Desulfovibrionaceae bacterium]MDD4952022.1 aspartate 1-decarboxylase [Desulfovibrionaceae bacterium]